MTLKRMFDIIFSLSGLMLFSLIVAMSWLVSLVETRSNGFFFQARVGKNGKTFILVKIKTMKNTYDINNTVTTSNDHRITYSGKFFRSTKIDELPQLWNVLIGDMSIVGPRPDVSRYADKLDGDDKIILSVRPGITGPAQLAYKNEEKILARKTNPIKYNDEIIWPDKVRINKKYIKEQSLAKDIYYIWKTVVG